MDFLPIIIMALCILNLNYNGNRDQSKRNGIVRWLQNHPVNVDVVSVTLRMGVFCNVNYSSVPNYFVCVVFMALIVTLRGINSWMIFILGLVPRYQLLLLATLIRFLTVSWIELAPTPLTLPVRALPLC